MDNRYKLNRKCECGCIIGDRNTTGKCEKCQGKFYAKKYSETYSRKPLTYTLNKKCNCGGLIPDGWNRTVCLKCYSHIHHLKRAKTMHSIGLTTMGKPYSSRVYYTKEQKEQKGKESRAKQYKRIKGNFEFYIRKHVIAKYAMDKIKTKSISKSIIEFEKALYLLNKLIKENQHGNNK